MKAIVAGTLKGELKFFGRVIAQHTEAINHEFDLADIRQSFDLPFGIAVSAHLDGDEADLSFAIFGATLADFRVPIGGVRPLKIEINPDNEFVGTVTVAE
jgi:hypothetical protein